MSRYRRSFLWACVTAAACSAWAGLAQETMVTPGVAAAKAQAAFAGSALPGAEALDTDTYTVYEPDVRAIRASGAVTYVPSGYLVLVRGRLQQSQEGGGTAHEEGVLAQIRCGLDGEPWHEKIFRQPVQAFGKLGLGEDEARAKAEDTLQRKLGEGTLIEFRSFHFMWEFSNGWEKHYIDARSGEYLTEWDFCVHLVPQLGVETDPAQEIVFDSPLYLLEDAKQVPILMYRDTIAILPKDALPESECRDLVGAYSRVAAFEKAVFPPSPTPWPDVWILTFEKEHSEAEIQRIALELWQQDTVTVACPVFRKVDYSGNVFDFIFTYYIHVVGYPDSGTVLDAAIGQDPALEILRRRQNAPEYPVRYSMRVKKGGLNATALIELSNRFYSHAHTKFAGPRKLVIYHPMWEQLDLSQGD